MGNKNDELSSVFQLVMLWLVLLGGLVMVQGHQDLLQKLDLEVNDGFLGARAHFADEHRVAIRYHLEKICKKT